MRALLARLGLLLVTLALSAGWAQPTITSLQSSTLQNNTPSNVTAITGGSVLTGGGMKLFINGVFLSPFQSVLWQNTATNVTTTFVANVSVTSSLISLTIPNALFAAVVSAPVTVNVTVQESAGVSNIARFTINPPLGTLGPVLPVATVNQPYAAPYAQGGTAPYNGGGLTGSFPPGIDFDLAGNGVQGTPSQTGLFTFAPTVTDFWGNSLQPTVTIEVVDVPTLTSVQPATAAAGSPNLTITLSGTNFVGPQQIPGALIPGSVAQWTVAGFSPVTLNSTLTNAGTISAVVPASLLTTPNFAAVTVLQPGGSASNPQSFTVIGASAIDPPLYSPANTVPVGTAVTMNTLVHGSGVFDGGVTFTENGTVLGSSIVVNLSASFTTSGLAAGVHNIVANYGGDGIHTSSSSAATTLTIVGVASLSSISPNTAPSGSPALTLTVNGANFVPASVVTFNGAQIATEGLCQPDQVDSRDSSGVPRHRRNNRDPGGESWSGGIAVFILLRNWFIAGAQYHCPSQRDGGVRSIAPASPLLGEPPPYTVERSGSAPRPRLDRRIGRDRRHSAGRGTCIHVQRLGLRCR